MSNNFGINFNLFPCLNSVTASKIPRVQVHSLIDFDEVKHYFFVLKSSYTLNILRPAIFELANYLRTSGRGKERNIKLKRIS